MTSRTERVPFERSSPRERNSRTTRGHRKAALAVAVLPRSMRRAISTSPSRVSSGAAPISRRYTRTGSPAFLFRGLEFRRPAGSFLRWAIRLVGLARGIGGRIHLIEFGRAEVLRQPVDLFGLAEIPLNVLIHLPPRNRTVRSYLAGAVGAHPRCSGYTAAATYRRRA